MNRIEKVRDYVDKMLLNMSNAAERRCGYVHLYGVSEACALIALKRNENVELAVIAGMLHDVYCYAAMDSKDHAQKSAMMAKDILETLEIFSDTEMKIICAAISHHSNKTGIDSAFDEVLKDADVLQHALYNPLLDISEHKRARFEKLKAELGLL